MRLFTRLSKFISIGLISTIVHYLALGLFLSMNLELWISNLLAFTLAFMFSFSWQQRYTFADRLGPDSRLNQKALLLVYFVNLILSAVSSRFIEGWFALLLPLLPAAGNYITYYITSGLRVFKVKS